MEARKKGTVTSLSSLFPAEEAQKAAQRVKDNIAEKHKELDNVNHFIDDNTSLINLVHRLPDELHHHIMVPFGKAAFFPGRLVHTNEFMVLLGEGYFAERSAKQTVDILKRRGNLLDSQVDSLRAVIEDLKTEASFFDRTAADAAEGLVEIREEYTGDTDDDKDEEDTGESMSNSVLGHQKPVTTGTPVGDSATKAIDAEEYARMMARFDELEKEELESEDIEQQYEDEHDEDLSTVHNKLNAQPKVKDGSSYDKVIPQTFVDKSAVEGHIPSVPKTSVQPVSKSKPEASVSLSNREAGNRMSKPFTDSLKAFTGSIVERTVNLETNPNKETNQPSKPISRFKMQRRGGQT
ncbi:hypothetical protein RND81_02G038900 [Saponaria officinalis]|uniref:RNA polymerase II subunit 5-mediating protein homolog n=1 Tax=Saponaria officinalis TaxID=3572 RepID=A0AAW1MJE6_SAPOF